ncbi:MAG: DUF3047 domain-containing protein [Gammaproteobacteria bacterium]
MKTFKKYILFLIFILASFLMASAIADLSNKEIIQVAQFSEMNMKDWENKSFEGETLYTIKSEKEKFFLYAKSTQSASALYKKIKVNIHETPFLNWSWRIDQALPTLNEKTRIGDDYAARVYVVFKTGFTPLSAKALNYVWSSNDQSEGYWPNAYTDKAIMVPLRSNRDETNTWQNEKINIKEDLLKYFDKPPKYIDGIAIMTDTDNSQGIASASYGDIYFSRK